MTNANQEIPTKTMNALTIVKNAVEAGNMTIGEVCEQLKKAGCYNEITEASTGRYASPGVDEVNFDAFSTLSAAIANMFKEAEEVEEYHSDMDDLLTKDYEITVNIDEDGDYAMFFGTGSDAGAWTTINDVFDVDDWFDGWKNLGTDEDEDED